MASFAEINKNSTVVSHASMTTFKDFSNESTESPKVLEVEFRKYIRNKILYECLEKCVSDMNCDLGNKLEKVINNIKLKQYCKLQNHNLLGVKLDSEEVTYQEAEKLKLHLQKSIYDKRNELFQNFKTITQKDLNQVMKGPQVHNSINVTPTEEDQVIISYRQKLAQEQEIFMKNIKLKAEILEEILSLRLEKIPKMCKKADKECNAKIESNYLKSKIVTYKTKLDIFTETPKAISAYQEILKDIKRQQEECELSIENMKEYKTKYDAVGGKEYDEILKSYLIYKHSIDKLNEMYAIIK